MRGLSFHGEGAKDSGPQAVEPALNMPHSIELSSFETHLIHVHFLEYKYTFSDRANVRKCQSKVVGFQVSHRAPSLLTLSHQKCTIPFRAPLKPENFIKRRFMTVL